MKRMRFTQQFDGNSLAEVTIDREEKVIRDVVAMQIGRGQDSRNLAIRS